VWEGEERLEGVVGDGEKGREKIEGFWESWDYEKSDGSKEDLRRFTIWMGEHGVYYRSGTELKH